MTRTSLAALTLLCGLASGVWAVEPPQDGGLGGPAVREGGVPGDAKSFSGGPNRRREGDRPLAHRTFLRALDAVRDDAPEALRLSGEQEKTLRELERTFQTDTRAYFEKHRATVEKARESLGLKAEMGKGDDFRRGVEEVRRALSKKSEQAVNAREKAEKAERTETGAKMDENASAAREQAREQLQRIYTNAPKAGEVHTRQWAVLNAAQQAAVSKEIERLQTDEEEQRKNFLSKRDTLKQDLDAVAAGTKEVDPGDSRLPEKMRERLAKMTVEQRREAVKKFIADRERRKNEVIEKKPAPTMDDVPVPMDEER